MHVTGAYGREAKLEDWHAGKDFLIICGPYCSKRDLHCIKSHGYTDVVLIAKNATVVATINIEEALK